MLRRGLLAAFAALALAAPALAADDPRQDEQWGLAMVEAPAAWPTSTGVGAVVAVIDSGVQVTHPDLAGQLLPGYDFVGDDPIEAGDEDDDPTDGNGHGTHVSGIVAAAAGNGRGVAGVAPGAKVLPFRVLDDEGSGYADDTTKALNRAIDAGADVINLSLGDALPLQSTFFRDDAFEGALRRALAAGIVVVLAGGNNGLPLCENPKIDGILCVGSVDNRGVRSLFSSFGADIDIYAPGGSAAGGSSEDILSTWLKGGYESIAGTSQATPHVAGVAALLVSVGVRGQEATQRMLATAAEGEIVNAAAAVDGLAPPPPVDPPEDPGDPPVVTGSFSAPKSVKARRARRRGINVVCTAVRPGVCAVRLSYKGKKIGAGRADVPAGSGTTVIATLNKAGRRRFAEVKRKFRVGMSVTLPGESSKKRKITVKR